MVLYMHTLTPVSKHTQPTNIYIEMQTCTGMYIHVLTCSYSTMVISSTCFMYITFLHKQKIINLLLKPIALRKAKIVCIFGLSECNSGLMILNIHKFALYFNLIHN